MKLIIPSSNVKVKFLRTLPISTILCYKYRVEDRAINRTLTKEASPYLGEFEGFGINVPDHLLRFNIMSGLNQKIQELEALNKQLLANCSPTDKMDEN